PVAVEHDVADHEYLGAVEAGERECHGLVANLWRNKAVRKSGIISQAFSPARSGQRAGEKRYVGHRNQPVYCRPRSTARRRQVCMTSDSKPTPGNVAGSSGSGSFAAYLRLLSYVRPYTGWFVLSILGFVVFAASEPAQAM